MRYSQDLWPLYPRAVPTQLRDSPACWPFPACSALARCPLKPRTRRPDDGVRRALVGRRHQPVASDAARPREPAVPVTWSATRPATRSSRCCSPNPDATSGLRIRSSLSSATARSAWPPPGRDGRRARRDLAAGGGVACGPTLFPPREDAGSDALHASAVQHVDRTHLQPEPERRARLRHAIVANGFPPGVLMIDEGWFEPLRRLGLRPQPISAPEGDDGRTALARFQGDALGLSLHPGRTGQYFAALLHDRNTGRSGCAAERSEPARNRAVVGRLQRRRGPHQSEGREWFTAQLRRLVDEYGVDGFKFDGGDAELFAQSAMLTGAVAHDRVVTPNGQTEAFARIGLDFPLNEFRASGRWAASRSRSGCATRSTTGRTCGSWCQESSTRV